MPTQLTVIATPANKWGKNRRVFGDEHWDYYRGDHLSPKTLLITKKGHINVPELFFSDAGKN